MFEEHDRPRVGIDATVARIAKRWDVDAAFLQALVEATLERLQVRQSESALPATSIEILLREQGLKIDELHQKLVGTKEEKK